MKARFALEGALLQTFKVLACDLQGFLKYELDDYGALS